MTSKQITVAKIVALESHEAANFIRNANRFESYVTLTSGENQVNAKSLMGLMSLGVKEGASVEITANGRDETEAVETLAALLI